MNCKPCYETTPYCGSAQPKVPQQSYAASSQYHSQYEHQEFAYGHQNHHHSEQGGFMNKVTGMFQKNRHHGHHRRSHREGHCYDGHSSSSDSDSDYEDCVPRKMCKPPLQASHCDETKTKIAQTNNNCGCKSSEKTHKCVGQNNHHNTKITQNNSGGGCKSSEKKHHGHFWHRHGNEQKNCQPTITNNNNNNKHHHDHKHQAAHSEHRLSGKITQCFGHGGAHQQHVQKPTSYFTEEEESYVYIEKKEERMMIVNKKSHVDGEKCLKRC